ncbi:PD40 domain-containing protein [Edaphobacter sp. HDX4]|uniref:TolB family protein n=1 Tax=Edaphobacter sp. HDX4 TaxID=2794064 RepID=UPI002FE59E7B
MAWVGKITQVADPQIKSDGKAIAVVVIRPNYEEDLNESELAVVDAATCKARSLTHGRKTASFPRWSPNGDRLAFLANDSEKHNQIFVLEMAGGEARQVTRSPTSIQQFAWKPDGGAFAFVAADEAEKKKGADKFDDAFEVGNGSYLDREEALPSHLWLIPADGGEAKRLTSGSWPLPVAFPPGPPASPIAFTANGAKLIYVRLENTYSGDRGNSSPQALDMTTGKSEPITTHTKLASFPVLSSDGSHLAYIYQRDGLESMYRDVYVVSDGHHRRHHASSLAR